MITNDINKLIVYRVALLETNRKMEERIRELYETEVERLVDKHQVAVTINWGVPRWTIHHPSKGKHPIERALRRLDDTVLSNYAPNIPLGTKWEPETKEVK